MPEANVRAIQTYELLTVGIPAHSDIVSTLGRNAPAKRPYIENAIDVFLVRSQTDFPYHSF